MIMKIWTKEQLAELLNGKNASDVMTAEQERIASESNLLVLFGESDDLLEMRGAINGEEDTSWESDFALLFKGEKYSYTDVKLSPEKAECNMIVPLSDDYDNDNNPRLIRVSAYPDSDAGLCWLITSKMPCASFTINDDGELPYCKGIVIDLDEINR